MKSKRAILIFCCLSIFCANALATKFKGYDKKANAKEATMTAAVDRFTETETEFSILFVGHPSFYRLPKVAAYANQVHAFLETAARTHQPATAQFNPVTTEILYIGSDK